MSQKWKFQVYVTGLICILDLTSIAFVQSQSQLRQTWNWTNLDKPVFTPERYVREYLRPRPLHDLEVSDSVTYFKALCSTPQRLDTECYGWSAEDLKALRIAQETVDTFQKVLTHYFDFGFQMLIVLYVWGALIYLIWKRHYEFRPFGDPHYLEPTTGVKWFLCFDATFVGEEIKTIVVTDSEEDEEIFRGVDLSDCISESSENERKIRKENPNEYGRLLSRKIRHTDELKNPKYKNKREIKRKKKTLPNVNNPMHGSTVRNFEPPKHAGKKFDEFGTPKYPRIYEIRRLINQPNRYLSRL